MEALPDTRTQGAEAQTAAMVAEDEQGRVQEQTVRWGSGRRDISLILRRPGRGR